MRASSSMACPAGVKTRHAHRAQTRVPRFAPAAVSTRITRLCNEQLFRRAAEGTRFGNGNELLELAQAYRHNIYVSIN